MQGIVGVGYNAEFANTYASGFRLPGISAKYGLTKSIAVEGVVGVSTSAPANSVTAMKVFKNLFYENNLNFYFMSGLGLLNFNAQSSVELLTGFGVEFFIPGLESLGFTMETGASYNNSTGKYALQTMGLSFLDAGVHFYF